MLRKQKKNKKSKENIKNIKKIFLSRLKPNLHAFGMTEVLYQIRLITLLFSANIRALKKNN